MADKRSAKELRMISEMCEAEGLDAAHILDNPHYDLLAVADTLRLVRAVRDAMDSRRI